MPAYPTSFHVSLTDFDAYSIARGARLYARNCTACHGPDGRGDGPQAKTLDIPPADLTAAHLWQHSDGDLFWFIAHGIESPRGGLSMPPAPGLNADAIWALIDFLRARNAGAALAADDPARGEWPLPVPAPAIDARCPDGQVISLESLRGQAIRVTATPTALALSPAFAPGDACQATAPELRQAYAIVTGLTQETLPGSIILIDRDGWLRARLPPDHAREIAARLREIEAKPLVAAATPMHHH